MVGMIKALGMLSLLVLIGCSPIRSVPQDSRHQLELTLHDLQTNLDDLRHDMHCFTSELQILDGKMQRQDEVVQSIKHTVVEKQNVQVAQLHLEVTNMQEQLGIKALTQDQTAQDLRKVSSHTNAMTSAITQYKGRLNSLEKQMLHYEKQFGEIKKLRLALSNLTKSMQGEGDAYVVQSGDSLEKLAKRFDTTIREIKNENRLKGDLIVIGQKLSIPK
jgi:chromosome segregation ATPase